MSYQASKMAPPASEQIVQQKHNRVESRRCSSRSSSLFNTSQDTISCCCPFKHTVRQILYNKWKGSTHSNQGGRRTLKTYASNEHYRKTYQNATHSYAYTQKKHQNPQLIVYKIIVPVPGRDAHEQERWQCNINTSGPVIKGLYSYGALMAGH